jgi:hypothetical protein
VLTVAAVTWQEVRFLLALFSVNISAKRSQTGSLGLELTKNCDESHLFEVFMVDLTILS